MLVSAKPINIDCSPSSGTIANNNHPIIISKYEQINQKFINKMKAKSKENTPLRLALNNVTSKFKRIEQL